jgi:hypothetical protein
LNKRSSSPGHRLVAVVYVRRSTSKTHWMLVMLPR